MPAPTDAITKSHNIVELYNIIDIPL